MMKRISTITKLRAERTGASLVLHRRQNGEVGWTWTINDEVRQGCLFLSILEAYYAECNWMATKAYSFLIRVVLIRTMVATGIY